MDGNHAIMIVKTNHMLAPKQWLFTNMEPFPGGTWLVLEATTDKGVDLICVGYKYNRKQCLCVVMTKGAGATDKTTPYRCRYNDRHGNVCSQ